MLINTIQELRLYFPAHAMDDIASLAGFIDNSEHDFLMDKIGDELYSRLTEYYAKINPEELAEAVHMGNKLDYYAELLLCCQRCIAFDAFSRAISVQAVSVSNMGVNVATADDYNKADKESIDAFKATCVKEAHAAVNRLLVTLEKWTKQDASLTADATITQEESERREIVRYWRQSRYYFLAASLIIPSAQVLQDYLNIYDSREKFIQMLPDLRYIQEEKLEPLVGEELLDFFVQLVIDGTEEKLYCRVIGMMRKAMAAWLEERTSVLKVSTERKHDAHDEAERHAKRLCEYIQQHQVEMPQEEMRLSPLYVRDEPAVCSCGKFENNKKGNVMFVTPGLN